MSRDLRTRARFCPGGAAANRAFPWSPIRFRSGLSSTPGSERRKKRRKPTKGPWRPGLMLKTNATWPKEDGGSEGKSRSSVGGRLRAAAGQRPDRGDAPTRQQQYRRKNTITTPKSVCENSRPKCPMIAMAIPFTPATPMNVASHAREFTLRRRAGAAASSAASWPDLCCLGRALRTTSGGRP